MWLYLAQNKNPLLKIFVKTVIQLLVITVLGNSLYSDQWVLFNSLISRKVIVGIVSFADSPVESKVVQEMHLSYPHCEGYTNLHISISFHYLHRYRHGCISRDPWETLRALWSRFSRQIWYQSWSTEEIPVPSIRIDPFNANVYVIYCITLNW